MASCAKPVLAVCLLCLVSIAGPAHGATGSSEASPPAPGSAVTPARGGPPSGGTAAPIVVTGQAAATPSPTAPNIDLNAEPPPAGWGTADPPPSSPSIAAASDGSDAFGSVDEMVRTHVQQARAHFSAGRYDEAIAQLEAAYTLRPNSNYLFSIAQSHRRAGRNRKALTQYERFLQADPNTSLRTETQNYISELMIVVRQEEILDQERRRPLWKKGGFWGVLASSTAAVGVALGVGLGVGLRSELPTLMFDLRAGNALTGTP